MIPEAVARYRERYREERFPKGYSGWRHLFGATAAGLVLVAFALSRVDAPSLGELATVPIAFLIANAAEYAGHRGPMHHRTRGLSRLFERHTRSHHRFFTREAMQGERDEDFQITLFPWYLAAFFLLGIGLPVALLLFWIGGANVGWLFVATVVSYGLTYEWLHLAYHAHPGSFLARLPGIGRLRRHHAIHHDPRLMLRHNFNITFPIMDRIVGSAWREGAEDR